MGGVCGCCGVCGGGVSGGWSVHIGDFHFDGEGLVFLFGGDVGGFEGGVVGRVVWFVDGEEIVVVGGVE